MRQTFDIFKYFSSIFGINLHNAISIKESKRKNLSSKFVD